MTDINNLTTFFGWCSIINLGILLFSTIILSAFKKPISIIHSKVFGINQDDIPLIYFQYLGNYKIAIILLNLVPYITLKIMS